MDRFKARQLFLLPFCPMCDLTAPVGFLLGPGDRGTTGANVLINTFSKNNIIISLGETYWYTMLAGFVGARIHIEKKLLLCYILNWVCVFITEYALPNSLMAVNKNVTEFYC